MPSIERGDPAVREYWTRIPDTRLDRGLEAETPGGKQSRCKVHQRTTCLNGYHGQSGTPSIATAGNVVDNPALWVDATTRS